MTPSSLARTLALAALLMLPGAGQAAFDPVNDDTDIFLANPSFTATRPNVLIFVDNSSNWSANLSAGIYSKKFDAVQAGLLAFFSGLNDSFNVGLAFYNEQGTTKGAYIGYAIRQMTTDNKTALSAKISGLNRTANDAGSSWPNSVAFTEMFSYFAGATSAYNGSANSRRDYPGNSAAPGGARPDGHAFADASTTTYTSPIVDGCQKNFIIFISNGTASNASDNDSVAKPHLASVKGATPTQFTLSPTGEDGDWADEYADFMSNSDCNSDISGTQNVYTYTIDVYPDGSTQENQHTALLTSVASKGKGKIYTISDQSGTSQFTSVLNSIFQEVQSVNSVFASTTLPVSVNVRGTNLNQVYIGVFRPDSAKSPRWLGNLKLYKLGVNTANNTLYLADSQVDTAGKAVAAENASTGFITSSAVSHWTKSSSYWSYRDSTLNGLGGSSDSPDGDLVEKGGAAQRLRLDFPSSQATRNLYTCTSGTGTCAVGALLSASPFSTSNSNILAADMGAYLTYSVATITSSGTTASVTLNSTPSPAFSNGNTVRIAGASPSTFNGDYTIASVAGSGLTFNYTLPGTPSSTTAVATTSAAHNISQSDLITVTGASPSDYLVADAYATRLSATTLSFPLLTGATTAATTVGTLVAKKDTSLQTVTVSGSGSTATATYSVGHGYTVGSLANFKVQGACGSAFNTTAAVTATVTTTTSLTYPTPATIPGTPCGGAGLVTAVRVTAAGHELQVGDRVTITGVGTNATYHVTNGLVSAVSSTTFDYTPSAPSGTASGTYAVVATRSTTVGNAGSGSGSTSGITNGTGGNRNRGDVKTANAHNISASNWKVSVANVQSSTPNFNVTNATILSSPSVSATTFSYTMGGNETASTNASCGTTCTTAITFTFSRNSLNVTGNATNFAQISSDSTAGITSTLTFTSATSPLLSSLAVQSSATGTITAGRTTDADATSRANIINWVRGADNNENENSATTPAGSDIRPSVHGDVLHSRPAVVNYNRYGDDNDVYAFYGSNDGVFHALKGGIAKHTTGSETTLEPGTERWGFVPKEFFSKLKRLRDATPLISNVSQKDYFADGSIGIYQKDAKGNGTPASPLNCIPGSCSGADTTSGVIGDNLHSVYGDKVYLYVAMRRGGSFMYALDVTVPTTPKLLWTKGSSDTNWTELGQTWSEPKITKSQASVGNTNNPDNVVLVFGMGYDDAVEDVNPCLLQSSTPSGVLQKAIGSGTVSYTSAGSCTITGATGSATSVNRTKGRGIIIVDAFNGNVVFQASSAVTTSTTGLAAGVARKLNVPDMTCAIPSDVTVLDKNRDGSGDRVYVGDTCGQIWRLDMASSSMDDWTVTKVASISSSTTSDIANQRKFLFPPDLVFSTDASGNYTAVLLGSGDREHPFDASVVNRFYMFKDRDSSDPGDPQSGATNATSKKISTFGTTPTGSALGDGDVFDATSVVLLDGADAQGLNGWKITLSSGEKNVGSAVTVSGTTFFNTNQPSSEAGGGTCGSNLGIAREYQVGYANAEATSDLNGVGGITVADRSVIHAGGGYLPSPVPVVVEIDGKKYQAVISGTSVQTPPGLTLEKRTRSYWYKDID